ncbi:hypothetical protein CR51_36275 [Caballeronia megalochromosomata]|nr:hypothetical protein CR51_36275 [Caballeronia megalochromosomata]
MKAARIETLLPFLFRQAWQNGNPVVVALLYVMEDLHARPEEILANLDAWFDPLRAPDSFVPWLARWVDLDRFFTQSSRDSGVECTGHSPLSVGLARLRELIREASYLSKWRGTRRGLTAFLETAIGVSGFEVDEEVPGTDGAVKSFHIRVRVPEAAQAHLVLIEQIVQSEKPAHVTYEVQVATSAQGD